MKRTRRTCAHWTPQYQTTQRRSRMTRAGRSGVAPAHRASESPAWGHSTMLEEVLGIQLSPSPSTRGDAEILALLCEILQHQCKALQGVTLRWPRDCDHITRRTRQRQARDKQKHETRRDTHETKTSARQEHETSARQLSTRQARDKDRRETSMRQASKHEMSRYVASCAEGGNGAEGGEGHEGDGRAG